MDLFWNIANKLYKKKFNKVARFFEIISMIISSHAISANIEVGNGTIFYHHGLGCTVLEHTHIGKNCKIFQNITIGNRFSASPPPENTNEFCSIGDGCLIGAGAVILGKLSIGNNVSIGANAVVLHDISDNYIALGIPAESRLKKQT